ncbi:capsule assembly Wzi family protein [Daejeonella lutea]|uniref:Capsule assembly protein Wzi n=1 Tax=Daejeonella lutea TaxID=572036 RepID=A0A1T5FAL0_9SPHI|nr:capsule assembly Wzi family protein [Daejeonella lutea]SKB93199.1 Capsule assembly protein Wzi [Daejeonella lutea]
MNRRLLYICIVFFFSNFRGFSQSLPVGMHILEDVYRREQLIGRVDSTISFTVRPLFTGLEQGQRGLALDTIDERGFTKLASTVSLGSRNGYLQLMPVSWLQQYNSKVPYGWNDGSMIPAAGYQNQLSLGVYGKYGPLSIQLKPELVSAQNKEFEGLPTDYHNVIWAHYYDRYFNVTDIPERFGDKAYSKAFWGQSSIRLNFDPVSIGVSAENLFWGPGMRSSLLMSNNAPGFKHITLNTTRPVNTPIGSFEGQMVIGMLDNSGFTPPEINRIYLGRTLYVPKPEDQRYLTGFVLTYNPKVVPGLFIGASRTSQVYENGFGNKAGDFIPLLQPFERKNGSETREYMSSMFFRWVWKEANAEIYGEYGHNSPTSFQELLYRPDNNAAWLIGLRKLVPLARRPGEYLQAGIELTEIQQTDIPALGGWYTSNKIRQGHTNQGQVLGAGIGPGSNLQSLNIGWVKDIKRFGFQVERYLHNNDLYYPIFTETLDPGKHWVDMSYSLYADWNYKNLLVSFNGSMVRTLNYNYVLYTPVTGGYYVPGMDFLNYQVKVGVTYRF